MSLVYDRNLIRLHHGDCLSVMPTLGVQVDSVITAGEEFHSTDLGRKVLQTA